MTLFEIIEHVKSGQPIDGISPEDMYYAIAAMDGLMTFDRLALHSLVEAGVGLAALYGIRW